MKAKVELIESYAVTIDGVRHEGFRIESRWEGMIKLVRGTDVVIVADEPLGGLTRNIFGMDTELSVVKLTPGLLAEGEVRR